MILHHHTHPFRGKGRNCLLVPHHVELMIKWMIPPMFSPGFTFCFSTQLLSHWLLSIFPTGNLANGSQPSSGHHFPMWAPKWRLVKWFQMDWLLYNYFFYESQSWELMNVKIGRTLDWASRSLSSSLPWLISHWVILDMSFPFSLLLFLHWYKLKGLYWKTERIPVLLGLYISKVFSHVQSQWFECELCNQANLIMNPGLTTF